MKPAGIFLFVIGLLLAGGGLLWGRIGFYGSQVPILIVMLAGGAALMFIGSRMHRDKDPNKAVAWRPDAAAGDDSPATTIPQQAVTSMSVVEMPAVEDPVIPHTVDESTRYVPRRSSTPWLLTFPDGSSVPITHSALVGRDPVNPASESHSLVRLPNPDSSVSKTHALLTVMGSEIHVTDLGSTNGTVVIDAAGNETECVPNHDVVVVSGGTVDFGVYSVGISKVGAQ